MALLVLGIGALIVGFGLLLLISLTSPRQRPSGAAAADQASPAGFVATLAPAELGRLLTALLTELGFEAEDVRVAKNVIDILAVNRAPITGGRLYVRGVASGPEGVVGEPEVQSALETARSESAGKAIIATSGRFSAEARAAAAGAPLELVDGPALLALVKEHLPAMAAAGRVLN